MSKQNFQTIIIDDEPLARQIITASLKSWEQIEIVGECANGFEALKQIQQQKPHLIFLDIQMPKISGLELLEVLDNPPLVVFTTAFDQYALKAFELNAIDYLLKPFSQHRFNTAMEKVLTKLEQGQTVTPSQVETIREHTTPFLDRIVVKKGTNMQVISLEDILFLEAQNDYVMIYTATNRYLKQKTMKYYEEHLPPHLFLRIHRSFIVNITSIQKLQPYDKDSFVAIVPPDHKLKISRSGYKKLKEKLNF